MSYTIEELKEGHRLQMENYDREKRDFVEKHGHKYCDYYVHRLRMSDYHRGAYNALNEAERNLS